MNHTIEDFCGEECQGKYCLLKEFAKHIGHSHKTFAQMACIEIFKYEESAARNDDIGWDEAMILWVQRGHAKQFAEVYNSDISPRQIYKQITQQTVTT